MTNYFRILLPQVMLYCVRLASKRTLYKDFTRSTTFLNSWMLATAFHQLSGREILAFLTQRYLDNKVKFDNDWEKRLIILFVNWLNAQNTVYSWERHVIILFVKKISIVCGRYIWNEMQFFFFQGNIRLLIRNLKIVF